MGLGVKVLVRHPDGEPDLLCPAAWCDICGEELAGDTQDGFSDVYAFTPPPLGTDEERDFHEGKAHVSMYLVHGGRCFEALRDENGLTLPHMPTDWLIVHLAQNMGKGTREQDWIRLHRHVMRSGI